VIAKMENEARSQQRNTSTDKCICLLTWSMNRNGGAVAECVNC